MKVFLYPNFSKKNALGCAISVCDILSALGAEIFADEKYTSELGGKSVVFGKENLASSDIVIAIGGDGTILRAAKYASVYDIPVLGVNSGRLGFMASLEIDNLDRLSCLVSGDYSVEERMTLSLLHRTAGAEKEYYALNDIVISRPYSKLGDFTVRADGKVASVLRADGLVFSTPTGSTAYSLSAGGPIIEPDMECIEFTPICSHSLFSRTILFSPERKISVKHNSDGEDIYFCTDGGERIEFSSDDEIIIEKSEKKIKLVEIGGNKFFDSVNNKLMQSIKGERE